MVLNLSEESAFFCAYIKEKNAIDAALASAAKEASAKISLKQAFLIIDFSCRTLQKAA
jgi:hypothetical protein